MIEILGYIGRKISVLPKEFIVKPKPSLGLLRFNATPYVDAIRKLEMEFDSRLRDLNAPLVLMVAGLVDQNDPDGDRFAKLAQAINGNPDNRIVVVSRNQRPLSSISSPNTSLILTPIEVVVPEEVPHLVVAGHSLITLSPERLNEFANTMERILPEGGVFLAMKPTIDVEVELAATYPDMHIFPRSSAEVIQAFNFLDPAFVQSPTENTELIALIRPLQN